MAVSSPVTKRNPRPRKYASAAARQAAYRSRNEMLEFRAEPKTAETLTRIADTIDVSRSDLLLSMVKFALANHDWARFGLTHKTIPYYQGNPIMATKKPTAKQLEARARFAEMARSGAFKKRKTNPRKKTVSQKISQLRHEGYPQKQAVAVALSEERAGKVKRNPITETVIWGLAPGETRDYMEDVMYGGGRVLTKEEIEKVIAAATAAGYHSFRIGGIDMSKAPDFSKSVATKTRRRKTNPIQNEQHLFGNKYATIRQDGDGRFVAQVYEKVKTGIGEEIDYWGSRYYKTHAGAQRYLDSLKPVRNNPQKRKVSAVVLMNPKVRTREVAKGVPESKVQYAVHLADRPSYHAIAYFTKKADAVASAQEASDRTGKQLAVSRVQVNFGQM